MLVKITDLVLKSILFPLKVLLETEPTIERGLVVSFKVKVPLLSRVPRVPNKLRVTLDELPSIWKILVPFTVKELTEKLWFITAPSTEELAIVMALKVLPPAEIVCWEEPLKLTVELPAAKAPVEVQSPETLMVVLPGIFKVPELLMVTFLKSQGLSIYTAAAPVLKEILLVLKS